MRNIFRYKRTKKGSALIMVMVTMLVMGLVIMYALGAAREDTHMTFRQVRLVQARYLSEGAVERAKGDVLSQIAATNFLGGSFATIDELYDNIDNRFSVASKRIPANMTNDAFKKAEHSAAMVARAHWQFTASSSGAPADSTLDIPGVNDWGTGTTGAALGEVRAYIARSVIDSDGDSVNNTVGSYSTTVSGWAEAGKSYPTASAMTSKSYFHALQFPRLFDYLLLGNSLSDCSMCHLKIRGAVGQINPADPMEMHLAYNATRFNRLILYGSLYTNGTFTRAAAGENPAGSPNRQENMLWTPGQNGQFIYSANGSALAATWSSENGGATANNPFRSINSLADPLPSTWPSVKANLLQWFEPRAIAGVSSGASEIKNTYVLDNNIGKINTANFFEGHPFKPFIASYTTQLGETTPVYLTQYYPYTGLTSFANATAPTILYGVRDGLAAYGSVTAINSDGVADTDLDGNGTGSEAADIALAVYNHAIDRAPNRSFAPSATQTLQANVSNANPGVLTFNRGLHAADDFDGDTIPNAFDPDLDGDGVIESPRASTDPAQVAYHVTDVSYASNITMVPAAVGTRPQWTLGYTAIRFAQSTSPYTIGTTRYYVRTGSLLFARATNATGSAQNTSSTALANAANTGASTDIIIWGNSVNGGANGGPSTVLLVNALPVANVWPMLSGNQATAANMWNSTSATNAYLRKNMDAMVDGKISRVYRMNGTAAARTFNWVAQVSGVASGSTTLSAMQNLISNNLASTAGQPAGTVRGVFPDATLDGSGNPVYPATGGQRSLIMRGASYNPLAISGQVVVRGDVVIAGWLKGKGQIVTHRNIFIPTDLRYVTPPNWRSETDKSGDQLGLVSSGNILVGNIMHSTNDNKEMMEFIWGNMVDINSGHLTASTWNWGLDGSNGGGPKNHMINPIYLFDGAEAGRWVNGVWQVENQGNLVATVYNKQNMRVGGGLNTASPYFNANRKHVNFDGNSNPNTTLDNLSYYKNFYISTPGLLPLGGSRISAMPVDVFGTYTGAWFSPNDFKLLTQLPQTGTGAYTNNLGPENQVNWIKNVEGVLYADYGAIGGNIASSSGPNFLEFRGGIIARDIQIMSVIQNNSNDNGTLTVDAALGTNLVGGLYYDYRLKGAINPLAFPFTELFIGGEMAQNSMPDVTAGKTRDEWTPFRLTAEYKRLVEQNY